MGENGCFNQQVILLWSGIHICPITEKMSDIFCIYFAYTQEYVWVLLCIHYLKL